MQRGGIGGEAVRVGDQDVGARQQRRELVVEGSASVPERQAGDDRTVAEVQELEQRAVFAVGRARPVPLVGPAPERIALGRLDLDHVGAGVTEQLGAVPAGNPRRAVDHLQIREQIHGPNLPGSPRRGLGRPR